MQFTDLNLSSPILSVLEKTGYHTPTPIQSQAIPLVLQKNDVLACAQTGTGKTAAFSLPIIEFLLRDKHSNTPGSPLALIVCPTRELAIQIGENVATYTSQTKIRHAVVFGGVSLNKQLSDLKGKPEILIATPGRLLDLHQQGFVSLQRIQYLVLDEADRMLDMGFVHDIKRIIKLLPARRQNLLFSATIPDSIRGLANSILHKPAEVAVTPVSSTVETISQTVFPVDKPDKVALLIDILHKEKVAHILVFSRTKYGADKIVRRLRKAGLTAEAIHGNKSQPARQKALTGFKSGKVRVLVATDIAARGIDIDSLELVINLDLPNEPETYVHRIGRTGRAGASGRAWSFCSPDEIPYLWDIQKLTGLQLPLEVDHPYLLTDLSGFKQKPTLPVAAKSNKSSTRSTRKRAHNRSHNRSKQTVSQ